MIIKTDNLNEKTNELLNEFILEHGIESESIESFLDQFETIAELAKKKVYGNESNLRSKLSRGTIKQYKFNLLRTCEIPHKIKN